MSLLQATTFNFAGLIVARVGLGVFEAGFGPAIPLYFCKSNNVPITRRETSPLTQEPYKLSFILVLKWVCVWHTGLALPQLRVRLAASLRLACSMLDMDRTSRASEESGTGKCCSLLRLVPFLRFPWHDVVVKMFALAFIWPHPTVYILGSLVVCVLLSRRWILPNCCFVWTQRNAFISGVFPGCVLLSVVGAVD
jgi:hypothetical protein